MHVAIVSPYDPRPDQADDPLALRGGVEEALDRCASGLAARGHEVTVVTSAARDDDAIEDDGVRFVRVRRRAALFRNPLAPLHRHVPDSADVVHVPATYPFYSDLIPSREARAGRRATVLDYHFDVHGTSVAMSAAAWMHRHTLGRGMFRATRLVCKSLDYARHSRVLAPHANRLDWVPNGVHVADFRADLARGDRILCVGRLVPYKGVDTLLRAMPSVHANTGAELVVVGDGPEKARLQALAREVGAPVEFRGRVCDEALRDLYGSSRLTVLPSANSQEAFGMTLLESMASGTPVVASDLPGVREVASLAGLTAPAQDPDGLAQQITRAWEDPLQFGTPAQIRERVVQRYSWESVVARLEGVYAQALRDLARRREQSPLRVSRVSRTGGAG